jgi:hypothetical protein
MSAVPVLERRCLVIIETGKRWTINPNVVIGSPQHGTPDKRGLPSIAKIKTPLEPQILPGMIVDLDSLRKDGLHGSQVVQHVRHEGDTAGGLGTARRAIYERRPQTDNRSSDLEDYSARHSPRG